MGIAECNTTVEHLSVADEIDVVKGHTYHGLGLILCLSFGMTAVLISLFLMFMHATHFSKPWEQRHIIRILFMVPVYTIVSILSFYYYHQFVFFQVARDCYDCVAIVSFFGLLCNYIAPDIKSQKIYFRDLEVKNWLPPIRWFQACCGGQRKGPWRKPRSGLTWFNIIWALVFQYCFFRVTFTIIAVITQAKGRYCAEGLSPKYAHIWLTVFSALSVLVAMTCLFQFYHQIKEDIADHRPFSQLLSIKLVIFFIFWQTIILSFLSNSGAIKVSPRLAEPDIVIGIPATLICIEMFIFSLLHLWCYSWLPYDITRNKSDYITGEAPETRYEGGMLGYKAFIQAANPWDIIKAIGRGFKFAAVGYGARDQQQPSKQYEN